MAEIIYSGSADGIEAKDLVGFFVGWDNPPSPDKHLALLKNSDYRFVARDGGRVVGFITAITDKTLAAYVPFLEVLPEYQNRGIGSELVRRMMSKLQDFYMVDLICEKSLQSFYEKQGMKKAVGMISRNYKNQSGF